MPVLHIICIQIVLGESHCACRRRILKLDGSWIENGARELMNPRPQDILDYQVVV